MTEKPKTKAEIWADYNATAASYAPYDNPAVAEARAKRDEQLDTLRKQEARKRD